ncbi:pre-tRNA nuclear export protein [Dinochytrium kinnereticum]|nr:pre-tRNA nuclear export protein [Dinochytrium kinnereticum]
MEDLERAISVILDRTAPPQLIAEAHQYCDRVRADAGGWQLCLALFTAVPRRAPQSRFAALQFLEEVTRTKHQDLDPSQFLYLRQSLWSWIQGVLDLTEPPYIRNKLAQVVVVIFRVQYPEIWPTFFDDMIGFLKEHSGTPRSDVALDFFLKLCFSIDEEVVNMDVRRSEAEIVRNTAIKDKMRETAVVQLRDAWFSLLAHYWKLRNLEVTGSLLRIIGLYVAWVDIKLIVDPGFISSLYEFLATPGLRTSALQCLMGIAEKGMGPAEKLDLIQALRITDVFEQLFTEDMDESLVDLLGKFVNSLGMDLCTCWQNSANSMEIRQRSLLCLEKMFPFVIRIFENEFDDTSVLVHNFLDDFLQLLRDCWKIDQLQSSPFLINSIPILLRGIFFKMKYDEEAASGVGEAAGEDEALFSQMRQVLKGKLETISTIDFSVYMAYLSNTVISTFDRMITAQQNQTPVEQAVSWSEAELALYLISILKGNAMTPPVEEMVRSMIRSRVSTYQHPMIPNIYFDNVVKYGDFVGAYPDFLPEILESFVDRRGLHHQNAAIRSRIYYLFLRFVKDNKNLRQRLSVFTSGIIYSIQDVLRVEPPRMPQVSRSQANRFETPATLFDSQLYVFEAAGYLISLDDVDVQKQEELLKLIVGPLMVSLQEFLEKETLPPTSMPNNVIVAQYVRQLISAIGSVGKGFPDWDRVNKKAGLPLWVAVFKQGLHLIILALERLNEQESIREAARFAFQRLVGCVGEDVLPFFNPLVNAGLFRSCTPKEMSNFLPSVGQLMHKFKASVFPILNEVLTPIIERVFMFLNQTPSGFDEMNEIIELRKAYLTFVNHIFTNDLEGTLITEANSRHLNSILESSLLYACDPTDANTQKIALSLLSKVVLAWGSRGTTQPNGAAAYPTADSPSSDKMAKSGMVGLKVERKRAAAEFVIGIGGKNPLPGFEKFLYENVIRTLFEIPLKPGFDPRDAGAQLIFTELAAVHRTVLMVQGREYLDFLQAFLPTIQCPPQIASDFLSAIQHTQQKPFVAVLKRLYGR